MASARWVGNLGEQFLIALLRVGLGKVYADAHTAPRFHAFHKAIELHWFVELQASGKSCTDPKRIRGFDEHSAGADVARTASQNRGAPLNVEFGAKCETRGASAFAPPYGRGKVAVGHRCGETPCQRFRTAAQ